MANLPPDGSTGPPATTTPCWASYHAAAAAGVAGVLEVVVQQLGGPVLEGFGEGSQQHGELRGVELEQRDEHHLGGLQAVGHYGLGWRTTAPGFTCFLWLGRLASSQFLSWNIIKRILERNSLEGCI